MGSIILVTGGARSGKSAIAEGRTLVFGSPAVYVATAQALDAEMAERIAVHQARRGAQWRTHAEPLDLCGALALTDGAPRLVDCLTLWLTNLILAERDWQAEAARLARTLAALGGREQAAICGAVLAAREARVPVILDGFICTAAVAPLFAADPRLLDHCLVGHVSREPGHGKLLSAMGKIAILDLDMRLGEGTGAALALGIVRAALACHDGMATFADAGISGP